MQCQMQMFRNVWKNTSNITHFVILNDSKIPNASNIPNVSKNFKFLKNVSNLSAISNDYNASIVWNIGKIGSFLAERLSTFHTPNIL